MTVTGKIGIWARVAAGKRGIEARVAAGNVRGNGQVTGKRSKKLLASEALWQETGKSSCWQAGGWHSGHDQPPR